ncbi:MAG: hypothetical protein ACP5N1_06225 [Candidatus Woesearchaeota archaeon]
MTQERVKLGLKRAIANGTKLGRPKSTFNKELAKELLKTMSLRAVTKRLNISPVTLMRFKNTVIIR